MKEKGFTLVELLAALVIIGMLSTIVITSSIKRINRSKEKGRDALISSIELAAKNYALENNSIFNGKDLVYISLQTLVSNESFTNSLVDPTTKKALSLTDTVYVTKLYNGNLSAYYDINQSSKGKIVLNGNYNIYIKKGEAFVDPGVVATDVNGNNVTSSVTKTGTVDNTKTGYYTITYTYQNVTQTRNVVVY